MVDEKEETKWDEDLKRVTITLDQWFLTFFAPWTPKSQKYFSRTPIVSIIAIGGPLNPRDSNGYNGFFDDIFGPPRPFPRTPGGPWTPG
jgi:hypothetical protein